MDELEVFADELRQQIMEDDWDEETKLALLEQIDLIVTCPSKDTATLH